MLRFEILLVSRVGENRTHGLNGALPEFSSREKEGRVCQ